MIDVGAFEDFPDRAVTLVRAGGRELGIVRWNGSAYAVLNLCTHQRGPLCRGTLGPRLTATAPGVVELDDDVPVLACPWHGWEFDVRTGQALWDEAYAVRTYPTRIEEGRVLVSLERRGGRGSNVPERLQ